MTNHEKHIAMWNRLAETGGDDKGKVIDALFKGEAPLCDCYACESVKYKVGARQWYADCEKCPVEWSKHESYRCTESGTLYSLWCEEFSPNTRKLLAAQIRDLPWRTK